jgi:ABC-type glycerol-3-phosphate transport system permease component
MTEQAMASQSARLKSAQLSHSARQRNRSSRAVLYAIAVATAVFFMLPFLWAVTSSFKAPIDLTSYPPRLLPRTWHPENYAEVFKRVPFDRWTWNTLVIAVSGTLGAVLSSSLVGFSFARFRYPGRDFIFMLTLSTMMLPGEVTLIPLYIGFAKIGWLDTFKPLIIPSFFGGGAFLIFLMRQFFMTIPLDLDEAARIDGAGYLRIYWQIIMPLAVPALATAAVLSFISRWDNFMGPFIFLNSKNKFTLAVGVRFFASLADPDGVPTQHLLMASSLMMTVPIILLFFLAQRFFVRGIVMSGIKG